MVKPDVIVTQSYSMDYPLFRKMIKDNRHLFGEVIIAYYQDHRKYDFKDFVIKNMPDCTHIDCLSIPDGEDWRNYCINKGLTKSTNEWVLFIEQDFITDSDAFYKEVLEVASEYQVVGFPDMNKIPAARNTLWPEQVRLHPAFLLVKRNLIDETFKTFSAMPILSQDHFGFFSRELRKLNPKFYDISKRGDWDHLAGVTSNYMLVMEGDSPNYKPLEFRSFVDESMNLDVAQHEDFIKLSKECLKRK